MKQRKGNALCCLSCRLVIEAGISITTKQSVRIIGTFHCHVRFENPFCHTNKTSTFGPSKEMKNYLNDFFFFFHLFILENHAKHVWVKPSCVAKKITQCHSGGGHWDVRCCGIKQFVLRYFGNYNLQMRFRGILRTCGMSFFSILDGIENYLPSLPTFPEHFPVCSSLLSL